MAFNQKHFFCGGGGGGGGGHGSGSPQEIAPEERGHHSPSTPLVMKVTSTVYNRPFRNSWIRPWVRVRSGVSTLKSGSNGLGSSCARSTAQEHCIVFLDFLGKALYSDSASLLKYPPNLGLLEKFLLK